MLLKSYKQCVVYQNLESFEICNVTPLFLRATKSVAIVILFLMLMLVPFELLSMHRHNMQANHFPLFRSLLESVLRFSLRILNKPVETKFIGSAGSFPKRSA